MKPREWKLKKERIEVGDDGLHFESHQIADGEWVVGKENGLIVVEKSAYNKAIDALKELSKPVGIYGDSTTWQRNLALKVLKELEEK
jgi:hypothetical protein